MKPFRLFSIACLSFLMLACQPEKAETAKNDGASGAASFQAPAFAAEALDGTTVSSASLEGKAYIVNFFASWCPPCRAEIPDMVELQKEFEGEGFTFIGIAVNEQEDRMRSFMMETGINYPVAMMTREIVAAYEPYTQGGLRTIPTSFVVASDGTISSVLLGMQSRAAFEEEIRKALDAGKR